MHRRKPKLRQVSVTFPPTSYLSHLVDQTYSHLRGAIVWDRLYPIEDNRGWLGKGKRDDKREMQQEIMEGAEKKLLGKGLA